MLLLNILQHFCWIQKKKYASVSYFVSWRMLITNASSLSSQSSDYFLRCHVEALCGNMSMFQDVCLSSLPPVTHVNIFSDCKQEAFWVTTIPYIHAMPEAASVWWWPPQKISLLPIFVCLFVCCVCVCVCVCVCKLEVNIEYYFKELAFIIKGLQLAWYLPIRPGWVRDLLDQ